MEKKWSLQDVRPPEQRRSKRRPANDMEGAPRKEHRGPSVVPERAERKTQQASTPRKGSRRPSSRQIVKFGGVAVGVLALVLVIGLFRTGAHVTVEPKYKDVTVQGAFTAHMQPDATQLGYELLELEGDAERQVTANGEEEAEHQAEGTITIYNNYSDTPQRLIKNTRFESPDGLIFRIFESVEVPGRGTDGSGGTVPGEVTARVFADETGEQYNIDPSRFTVPGLEGTDQYDSIYAESKAAFSGGFKGTQYVVDDNESQRAQAALHDEIKDALLSRLENERPADSVLFKGAVTFTFESLPSTDGGDGLATIKERGTLHVPVFSRTGLASYIAQSTLTDYGGETVVLDDPATLTFAYASSTAAVPNLGAVDEIGFDLSGNARLIWQFDEDTLRGDLAGASKNALPSVLSRYPAILKAEANIRPFWKQSFPDTVSKIEIETQFDEAQ